MNLFKHNVGKTDRIAMLLRRLTLVIPLLCVLAACDQNQDVGSQAKDKVDDALNRRPAEPLRDAAEDLSAAAKDAAKGVQDAAKDLKDATR
jgi:predicted nucleic acid-binding protein